MLMKTILESALSDKRRALEGVRVKIRERRSRDFAVGARGNKLYFV
jgi:hypothetical protein